MTGGANGTETFVIQTVWMAFNRNRSASPRRWPSCCCSIVLIVTWIQRRVIPDEEVDLT